jgi:hypothetical protein
MLDTVVVQSVNPLTLHVTDVDPNEMFVLKRISGLTSAKAGLFTGDYAGEGSYYQGRRGEKLNPVITLKLNPDYNADISVSNLRERLYRAFYEPQPGSDGVKVLLQDDELPDRYFIGYTEDIDTDQFSQSRDVQISMLSMDAYLFSDAATSASDAVGWSSIPVAYDGSAKAGLEATFKVNTNTSVMTFDINGKKLILNRAFTVGQIITINTRKGERSIRVGSTDIMGALDPSSVGPFQLDRPANVLKSYGGAEGDGKVVMTSYNFRSQWWGI